AKPNLEFQRATSETSIFRAHVDRCPQGTVPIRRTRKEDLIRAKYLPLPTEPISNGEHAHEYFTGIVHQHHGETFHGAIANISIWKPRTNAKQYSLAEICLRSGQRSYTRIHVGWMVNPILYDSFAPVRNFIYWTADNGKTTGCWNTLCPGFVQVDAHVTPDQPFTVTSTFEGAVVEMQYHVYLSKKKWWYVVQGVTIGYWPAELFPLFGDIGVERIYYGGHSKDDGEGHPPPMGSGYFPNEKYNHAAYFTQMQYKNKFGALLDLNSKWTTDVIGCQKNYDMDYYGFIKEGGRRHTLQYGGPGGSC
ncbi:hypothetical protein MKW94_024333, partial [Papaver nudicaule]|nr:hypothetical protein [Papaver nudicaule]